MFARLPAAIAAATLVAGTAVFAFAPAAATVPSAGQVRIEGQGFTMDLGSKHAVGYFVKNEEACALTLMVAERVDPDLVTPTTGARLRVSVPAGQNASLETGEGAGLSIGCGTDAASIDVRPLANGA